MDNSLKYLGLLLCVMANSPPCSAVMSLCLSSATNLFFIFLPKTTKTSQESINVTP